MAYRPLLGMGKDYSLWHWEVGLTMLTTALGLMAFAAALERYFIRRATWLETVLLVLAAACLFWPQFNYWGIHISTWAFDVIGLSLFAAVVFLQIIFKPQNLKPLPMEAGQAAA
jgi:TRAP-type uncharacterized transport system fused permease subunit